MNWNMIVYMTVLYETCRLWWAGNFWLRIPGNRGDSERDSCKKHCTVQKKGIGTRAKWIRASTGTIFPASRPCSDYNTSQHNGRDIYSRKDIYSTIIFTLPFLLKQTQMITSSSKGVLKFPGPFRLPVNKGKWEENMVTKQKGYEWKQNVKHGVCSHQQQEERGN